MQFGIRIDIHDIINQANYGDNQSMSEAWGSNFAIFHILVFVLIIL